MSNFSSNILESQIFNSRKYVLELMDKQGFDVSGYENFSLNEVNAMRQNNQLDMLLETKNEEEKKQKVYIRYYLTKTIRPANIQELIDDLYILTETIQKTDMLYIIIREDPNETILNEIKELWEREGYFIVIESIKRLQFNILNHVLVPEHKILTDAEVEEIMIKYNVKDKNMLPDISRFDPVVRAIGMRPGQVCKITRPSKTAILAPYYKLCV